MPEELLPKPQTDLPLPDKDLPLPEKEIPANLASQDHPLQGYGDKDEKPKREFHFLRSFILGFLFVILIAVIGVGVFILGKNMKSDNTSSVTSKVNSPSPTPNPLVNWETYTNTIAKFSVQYPSGWKLIDSLSSVIIQKDDENQLLIRWGDGFGGGCDEKDQKQIQLKDETIKGCNYISGEGDWFNLTEKKLSGPHEYWSQIYLSKSINKYPTVSVSAVAEKDNETSGIILKMLSTLSYLDSVSNIQSVNPTTIPNPKLKTYSNKDYNFSFQYPSDFVINSNSTKDSISFLQKQDDLMAQRILVYIDPNKENLSLDEFVKENTNVVSSAKPMKISGHDAVLIADIFNLKQECGNGTDAEITRAKSLILELKEGFLVFNTTDSCETYETDWFSQIIPTIYFKY